MKDKASIIQINEAASHDQNKSNSRKVRFMIAYTQTDFVDLAEV